jgi:hypothetical protein
MASHRASSGRKYRGPSSCVPSKYSHEGFQCSDERCRCLHTPEAQAPGVDDFDAAEQIRILEEADAFRPLTDVHDAQLHDVQLEAHLQAADHIEQAVLTLSAQDGEVVTDGCMSLENVTKKLKDNVIAAAKVAGDHNKKAIDYIRRSSVGTILNKAAEHGQKAYAKSKLEHAAQKAAATVQAAKDALKAAEKAQKLADEAEKEYENLKTSNVYLTNV